MKTERRFVSEIRAFDPGPDQDADMRDVGGYAATFNNPTIICNYFREVIAPGAFTRAIAEDDVCALFNHDSNFVIGRNTAGTLQLAEDDKGLTWRAKPPATTWARDLAVSIDRRDISGCSFQFRALTEEWDYSDPDGLPTRTLVDVQLIDVSAVTYPQYDDTSVALRTLAEARERADQVAAAAALAASDPARALRLKLKRAQLDRLVG